jgi:tetratricopeptide (TPR) repeat protein
MASLAGALLLSATSPSVSQTTPDDLARKHFESGVAYLEESDYSSALKAFEKSYELSKRHEILVNIATVHERSGDLPAALTALERYLEVDPNGKLAETVKLRIANLKKRIAEAPPAEVDAGPTPEADAGTAPSASSAPPPPPPPPTPDRPEQEPNRIPAYIAFGVGGLAIAGAVVTGVLAQGKYDDASERCAPNCTDDDVSSGKTLALTSTILTGVAVVGVGVGAFLWFTGDSGEAPPASARQRRFDLQLGGGPKGARAQAIWRF